VTRIDCDLAILGSGFGGSLLAVIARRLGYAVALIERGRHPRFTIGESSTPLSNFKLLGIARQFGLDWLAPFAKYGTWKRTYPDITCGLKRGFTFFGHERGQPFTHRDDHANALIVASSPADDVADTQWLRSEFDAHIVDRARSAGVPYLDECEVQTIRHTSAEWELTGTRPDSAVQVRSRLLVDASGTGQVLADALGIQQVARSELKLRSRALYSHFTGVGRWQELLEREFGARATAAHPFRCDDSTLHHIIDGGWMWVIPFENGVTSSGFSLDPDTHPLRSDETAEDEWARLLGAYPSIARQFATAERVRPFVRTGRLQRRLARVAGADWAMLPHTAGFLDAWLSPGIAQTLFAVNRLGLILAEERTDRGRERRLAAYNHTVLTELRWVDEITGTCFACFDRFPILATAAMLYFVAAIYCEERERNGSAGPADAFLLADHVEFRATARRIFERAEHAPLDDAERFAAAVAAEVAPYNLGGLCDPARRNMYPFVSGAPTAPAA
jgi:FADH2 O2-dependent halogenase